MRCLLLSCFILCFSLYADAQTVRTPTRPDVLKVLLSEDGTMSVAYKNQPVVISNPHGLDSLMKEIPDLKKLQIEFESINADPEKMKAIDMVLKQCNCEIMRVSKSFRK